MLVRMKINDDLWLEEDCATEVEAFKAASRMIEIFKHNECGHCKSKDVVFRCRRDKDENDWLEIVCSNCNARLVYGQTKGKGGQIYPKNRWDLLSETQQENRKDEEAYAEKHYGRLPNKGWFIYKRKDD